MVKFHTLKDIEKEYFFEDAVVKSDVLNGDFGAVADGVFTPGEKGTKAIMQVEVGDDMYLDKYEIPAGSHVRVVDFGKMAGHTIEVYGAQLPSTYDVDDVLVSDANGKLVIGEAPGYKITKIVGNKAGVEATVVTE